MRLRTSVILTLLSVSTSLGAAAEDQAVTVGPWTIATCFEGREVHLAVR